MNQNRASNIAQSQQNIQRIPVQQQRPIQGMNQPEMDPLLIEMRKMDREIMKVMATRASVSNDLYIAKKNISKLVANSEEHSKIIAKLEIVRNGKLYRTMFIDY